MPPELIGLIGGVGSSLLNGIFGTANNNANQQNSLNMFNIQHQAAIDDWNRNNAYNSPAAQMGRFKDAGLNPNLIYGQQTQSPAIKSPDLSPIPRQPIHVDNPVQSMQMAQMMGQAAAQTGLLKSETNKTDQEAKYYSALADAQIRGLNASAGLNEFQNYANQQNFAPSHERLLIENDKLNAEKIATVDANTRANQLQPTSLMKAFNDLTIQDSILKNNVVQRSQMEQMTKNAEVENAIKSLELTRLKEGKSMSDPLTSRAIVDLHNRVKSFIVPKDQRPKGGLTESINAWKKLFGIN